MNNKTKYNWEEIQKYHDSGKSWKEISEYFGVSHTALAKAKNRNIFISRSSTEGVNNFLKKFGPRKGRKHSKETKQKLSEFRKHFLKENPDKVPYLLNHSRNESYPERYFREILENNNIKFEQEYRESYYSLDFKIGMIDLEIDGEQHYLDSKIINSDKRRSSYLESLGYTIIRVRWSEFLKLTYDQKQKIIGSIINEK